MFFIFDFRSLKYSFGKGVGDNYVLSPFLEVQNNHLINYITIKKSTCNCIVDISNRSE